MTGIPLLALAKRFGSAVRHDGAGPALRQARHYTWRRLTRRAASSLNAPLAKATGGADQYLHGVWQTLAREDAFHIQKAPAVHRKRRQIAMIADLNLPQCRKYRVEQLAAFWRARGVEFEYAHYQDIPRATRILQHATHLMEYRLQTGPAADMIRYEARRLRLPILYDLDDPLFSVSAYETYRNMEALDPRMKAHFVSEAPKYLGMMNGADIISVSTPGMAAHTALYTERPVYIRRNFADAETLDEGAGAMSQASADDGLFRVAFSSGSQGHEIDFDQIAEPLIEFITEDKDRRLMVIGHFDLVHMPPALKDQVEVVKFSEYRSYLAALRRANCAVMPLCDDVFNRCKSAVRVLDAASVGIPAIVADVGDFGQVVQHDTTGFVARTASDWLSSLRYLAENSVRAVEMGRAARSDLEDRWHQSDQAHIISPELVDWVEA
ncbi:Glycosyltransferase [Sulfitobacter noctilucicola]|uniref:Glycosyltransferase involved in cell wall biosynthesis n=1 Tax=Sulfitobacter noctilucicola TaxID=1342301 RepID=A0A7W6M581_9RHOB|nr:glycosyltransferase [Sulfitobacter noctilucicola]KIN62879.1 Glycosyltransferase [Sulfitobacter noctilucicola]MBB4172591.1 glycosyltransferase involved in cell wall biosynthesis [Sulfitobacter noctilucicola]